MFQLSWVILGLLLIGYLSGGVIGPPVSIVSGLMEMFFMVIAQRSSTVQINRVLKGAPWGIVFCILR